MEVEKIINELRNELNQHNHNYYVLDKPTISDFEFDKLLEESILAIQDRRRQIFSEIQKTLANELPQIYLWYPATIVVHRDRVSNLKIEPSGDWQIIRNAKLN